MTVLLNSYLAKFDLAPVYSEADVHHWFLPQDNIIEAYVVETPGAPGTLTDFVSFYTLPSTVMNHPSHSSIKAAYSFYNVATATPWVDLMGDALILAKRENFDVFNALDLMENRQVVEEVFLGRNPIVTFQRVPGEAEVRDRRRQPAVLPLQLEVPQDGPYQNR